MPYTLGHNRGEFSSGKNIIASEQNLAFIEEGATLDATAFATGYHDVGKIIAYNDATGKYEPAVVDVEGAITPSTDLGIVNVDFHNDGENDIQVGEVIISGSVYADKLADTPTPEIKAATPTIRYIHNPGI